MLQRGQSFFEIVGWIGKEYKSDRPKKVITGQNDGLVGLGGSQLSRRRGAETINGDR